MRTVLGSNSSNAHPTVMMAIAVILSSASRVEAFRATAAASRAHCARPLSGAGVSAADAAERLNCLPHDSDTRIREERGSGINSTSSPRAFFERIGSPRYIAAPMVEQSEAADRCKSKIMRAQRSSEEEEAHQPVPLPPPTGGHATRSEEEERLVQEIVLRQLKPNGTYGKNCARMCQDLMQKGVSLKSAGPLVQSVVHRCVGVDWRSSASLSTRIPSSYWPSAFPSWTPQSSGPLLAGPPFW